MFPEDFPQFPYQLHHFHLGLHSMMYSNCYFELYFFCGLFTKDINSSAFLVLVGDSGIICFNLDFILDFCIFYENDVFFFSTVTDSSVNFLALFLFRSLAFCCLNLFCSLILSFLSCSC